MVSLDSGRDLPYPDGLINIGNGYQTYNIHSQFEQFACLKVDAKP